MEACEIVSEVLKKEPMAQVNDIYRMIGEAEGRIANAKMLPPPDVIKDDTTLLLGPMHRNVYTEYCAKEIAKGRDDWECYNAHDTLFRQAMQAAMSKRSENKFKIPNW